MNQTKTTLALVAVIFSIVAAGCMITATQSDAATSGPWTYTVSDGNATLTAYNGTETNIVIPTALEGTPVTSIGASIFMGNMTIRSVVIPSNITHIGNDAFRNSSVVSVTIQGNPTMGTYIFRNCQSLNDVDFGESIQTLGTGMFNSVESLLTVDLPSSLTTILGSFNFCKNLAGVTIPYGVTTLSGNAFTNTGISSVIVPHSVTSISAQAFNQCRNLVDAWVHYDLTVPAGTFSSSNSSLIITEYAVVTLNGQYQYIPLGSSIDNYLVGFDWYDSNGDLWENALINEDVTLTSAPIVDPEDPTDPEDPVEPRPVPIYPQGTIVYSLEDLFQTNGSVPQFPTYFAIEIPEGNDIENLRATMSYTTDSSTISTIWYYPDYGVILAYLYVSEYGVPSYHIFFDVIDENGVRVPWICYITQVSFESEYEIIGVMIDSPTVELETNKLYYIEFEGDETLVAWSPGINFIGSRWIIFNESGTFTVDAELDGVVTTYTITVSDSAFASQPLLVPVDPTDPGDTSDSKDSTILWILISFTAIFFALMVIVKRPIFVVLTIVLAGATVLYFVWG